MPEGLPLAVEGLRVEGRDGRLLLDIPALELPAGGSLAVTGASGAGKSTLLHALAGLVRPARGHVRWGATDLAGLPEGERARLRRERLGLVFQDFLLFEELSPLSNAALAAAFAPRARRAAIEAGARAWLDRLGLGDRAERDVRTLSGGERQRVAVARALAPGPAAILADEPTASLDRVAADRLIDDLCAAAALSGATLICVTHDTRLVERLGSRLHLADGRPADPFATVLSEPAPAHA